MEKQVLLNIPRMRVVNILINNITILAYKHIPKNFIGGWVNIYDGNFVVARFKFNRYIRIPVKYSTFDCKEWTFDTKANNLLKPYLLSIRKDMDTLSKYAKGRDLYLWFIDDLEIFTPPKTLDMFSKPKKANYEGMIDWDGDIIKPPQTWRYVTEKEDENDTSTS